MAGEQGFEPRYYGPEPYVLPLDDSPNRPPIILHVKLNSRASSGRLPLVLGAGTV